MRRVVVTGIGLITPIGIGKEEFWKNNKEGKSGICDMPELEKFGFESKAYGYVKNFKPEQLGLTLREIRKIYHLMHMHALCLIQLQMKYHIVMVLMEPVVQWQQDVQQELIL